tara:strand:- start:120 stop:992 length:873 start_codon:yes stop_codon:yes gene_type:complete
MTTKEEVVDGNPFAGPDLSESQDFFNSLDNELGTVEHLEQPTPMPEQVTSQKAIPEAAGQQGNENVNADINWQKRYNDSSNEARRLKAENDELQPFKSVINFLKEDSGAVEVLQNYLKGGGQVPQSMQDKLGLDEDFSFDMDEATKDPESDSGKLLDHMVSQKAQAIVNNTLAQERQKADQARINYARSRERQQFMEKHNYSEEDMSELESRAKQKPLTYDDMHLILNKDTVSQNVHQNAQQEMLNQMNAVRNIPTSIGGTNNAGQGMSSEEQNFVTMFGNPFENDDNPF